MSRIGAIQDLSSEPDIAIAAACAVLTEGSLAEPPVPHAVERCVVEIACGLRAS